MAGRVGKGGARVLYITYDGLTDPLGRSQVLPYLTGLAELGHEITILSCEKPERMHRDGARMRKLCADAGLNWHPLAYHKAPPILSSALDTAALQRTAIRLQHERPFDIVHCRSYIPARAGLALKRRFGVKFLFDMRGFWPDEKIEGNNWNLSNPLYGAVYRYFKRLESRLLRGADHIISLTEAGKSQLLTRPELAGNPTPITVIPCCVDFDHFPLATEAARLAARRHLAIDAAAPVLAYLGSIGTWYMLEEMLDFFKVYALRHPDAHFLLVTPDPPESVLQAAHARGVDASRLIIRAASREEVPQFMAAADLGIFFIKPVFSKTASSPTKMGEMLATGLPIVTTAGVGDVEAMVDDMNCGVAVHDFTTRHFDEALDRLGELQGGPRKRRDRAFPWFDLDAGVATYDKIYQQMETRRLAVVGA